MTSMSILPLLRPYGLWHLFFQLARRRKGRGGMNCSMLSITSSVSTTIEDQDLHKRVLVADDDPALRETLLKYLTRAGYRVCLAESGIEALRTFWSEGRFDLLITDLVMPGPISGRLLSIILRHLQPSLPVMFLSGFPPAALSHCHGVDANEVRLMKPVQRGMLCDTVSRLLTEL